MLLAVFLALFLPCAGMSAVFVVYLCLLWYGTNDNTNGNRTLPVKAVPQNGLTELQLQKLPKASGKDLEAGAECAVCLDDIEPEQPVRVVPGCNHGFHLQCADTWLSKNNVCPLCRTKIEPLVEIPLEPLVEIPLDDSPC